MCGSDFGNEHYRFEMHIVLKACQQDDYEQNFEVDDNERFPCLECQKTYANKKSLVQHVRRKHSGPVEEFECQHFKSVFKLES